MRSRSLLLQIYLPFLTVTFLSLGAVAWVATNSLRSFYREQAAADLHVRAQLVLDQVAPHLINDDGISIQNLCEALGKGASARITVILPDGSVIGDSDESPAQMENHIDRPEIRDALQGKVGQSERYSHTLMVDMLYFALPITNDGKILGLVRTSMPLTRISEGFSFIYQRVSLTGLFVAFLAAAASLGISRRITRPLEEMKQGAERFARGDFTRPLHLPQSEEMGALAEALNQMAAQLEDRLQTVISQRNELEAVFSSMVEGVLAVDRDQRLIGLNNAAARLLNVVPTKAIGEKINDVISDENLLEYISKAVGCGEPVVGDVFLRDPDPRYLQVRGALLRDSNGVIIGAVMALEDVTRLRQLEEIRRDFVANVSHELRTPITSIKGFVETLLDGAMADPVDARRFLEIIATQSERLNAIITDLLSLSRIERDEENEAIQTGVIRLSDILELAAQTCLAAAEDKNIQIAIDCDSDISLNVNSVLIEQAVVNLVDNAIKHSEEGKPVRIAAAQSRDMVSIQVIDEGCGIAREHLPRLFERFYRIDKARSRKMGGTGLGLAIVKHIAQAHAGRVSVESVPGSGSVFTIHLPKHSRA